MEQKAKPSNRIAKLNSLVQKELGIIIRPYLEDVQGLVTITQVSVSRDLKHGKVWLSVVGGSDDTVLKALQKNIYDIQGELNHALTIKVLPRIHFEIDTSPRYAQHISDILKDIDDK